MRLEIASSVSESGAKQVKVNVETQSCETILRGSTIERIVFFALSEGGDAENDQVPKNFKQESQSNGSAIGDFAVALMLAALLLGGLFLPDPLSVFVGWIATFLSFAWAIRKFYLDRLLVQPYAGNLSVIATWLLTIVAILLASFTLTVFMSVRC